MRFRITPCAFFAALNATESTPAPALWSERPTKREKFRD